MKIMLKSWLDAGGQCQTQGSIVGNHEIEKPLNQPLLLFSFPSLWVQKTKTKKEEVASVACLSRKENYMMLVLFGIFNCTCFLLVLGMEVPSVACANLNAICFTRYSSFYFYFLFCKFGQHKFFCRYIIGNGNSSLRMLSGGYFRSLKF